MEVKDANGRFIRVGDKVEYADGARMSDSGVVRGLGHAHVQNAVRYEGGGWDKAENVVVVGGLFDEIPLGPPEVCTLTAPRTDYHTTAEAVAKLVTEKQKAYGDSFGKSGEVLKVLYPDGIKVEQYQDVLTITRILDKMFRIATDKDAFGEDPWTDVLGYSLLAASRKRKP